MSFASIAGLVTHYNLEGRSDGRPLLFVNSLGTDLRLWDAVVPDLTPRYAVLRYDQRGHGLTDCPPGEYTIAEFADDLQGLVELLQLTELALVGISIGGLIAIELAARAPELVKALILLDTQARIGSADSWGKRIEAVERLGMDKLTPQVLPIWFSEAFATDDPATWSGYRNMLARSSAQGYAASCAALRDDDLTDRLALVRCPALVLAGEFDLATPVEQCRQLAESLPEGRFEAIAGAGHLPCVERPAQVALRVSDFLEECGYV